MLLDANKLDALRRWQHVLRTANNTWSCRLVADTVHDLLETMEHEVELAYQRGFKDGVGKGP